MPPSYPWHSQIDILMFLGDRFQIQASEGKMRMTKSLHYMN